ncbi:sesquiterpene cyclase protein [Stemphylium lycopersici]|uniref:Sesquiterpene cyclase protein n=1 Tax=Stemphylium lycopersici TaxID=183478 RepID=A0A364MST4_STELY|nr:sesquiterpene cyclase protein [Stemphylium lycopersici]RAQ98912.1 sesquiterpene cyclase protein [Stemphylium lycopersici]RAR02281.1 sesquiterpene cyclase protein [Stemphylium lycopersici]
MVLSFRYLFKNLIKFEMIQVHGFIIAWHHARSSDFDVVLNENSLNTLLVSSLTQIITMKSKQAVDLTLFNSKDDDAFVWPIRYSYDYMSTNESSMPSFVDLSCFPDLAADTVKVEPVISAVHIEAGYSAGESGKITMNSIPVFPTNANLPWHSSIHYHFASDPTATKLLIEGGRSYAEVAAKELPILNDNWTRFSGYLWLAASEKRLKLLAETIVYVFIFDGSLLQQAMQATIKGLHDEDGIVGDGGAEVAARLIDFINHPPPPSEFSNLRGFLDYRITDAAVQ